MILYEALTGRVPFEAESAVAVAMKQVSQTPLRPSSINPAVSPALDAVVMRALEKDPGQRFQNADAFIAALDAALKAPATGGTADFAALPPVVAVAEEPVEEEPRRNWLLWGLLAAAIVIGLLVGLLLTRDTSTEVPKVTGNQLNVAISLLQQDGFSVGEVKRVEREVAPNTVLEQDPAASPPGDQAELDCAFLTLFCSKPEVTLTVSNGPGSSEVPATAGLSREEATEKLEAAGFGVKAETVSSDAVEEGLVIHSEPSAGETATNGSDVTIVRLRRAEAGQGAGPGRQPAPARGAADPRPRPHPERLRRRKQLARRRGDQPVAQRRQRGRSRARPSRSSSPPAKQQAKVPNVVGKLRAEAVQAVREAGLNPTVEEEETEVEGKIGRAIDQFPPFGSEVEPGETVTIVVGKRAAPTPEAEE